MVAVFSKLKLRGDESLLRLLEERWSDNMLNRPGKVHMTFPAGVLASDAITIGDALENTARTIKVMLPQYKRHKLEQLALLMLAEYQPLLNLLQILMLVLWVLTTKLNSGKLLLMHLTGSKLISQ